MNLMPTNVLVVEDDEATAELETRALRRSGFEVVVAATLEEALEHLRTMRPSAVVLDFNLGADPAWPVLEASSTTLPAIPVIMVTAMGDERVASEAIKRGAVDYVIKSGDYINRLTQSAENAIRMARAEQALQQMRDWQSAILGSVDARMALVDRDGAIILANESWMHFAAQAGMDCEKSVVGRYYGRIFATARGISQKTVQSMKKGMREVLSGAEARFTLEYPWDGSHHRRWYRLDISPVQGSEPGRGAVVMHVDITERVEAEETRLADSELLQRVLQSVDEGILVVDTEATLVKWNRAAERILGLHFEDITQDWSYWLRPLAGDPGTGDAGQSFPLADALRGDVVTDLELRVADAEGLPIYISVNARPLIDRAGRIRGAVATFRDMTDRIARENEIRRVAAAVDQTADAVIITDTHGRIEYVNPAFERMYGYTSDEVMGSLTNILKHESEKPAAYTALWKTLKSGRTWSGRLANRTKSGERRIADITITPVRDNSGATRFFVASQRDVSEQVAMEAQLRQSQKMEAIGVLAGGIAHDFNNILAAIDGYSQMIVDKLDPESQERHDLDQVLRASERAKDLIRKILTFSRQAETTLRPVSLTTMLSESVDLMRATLPSSIGLRTDISVDDAVVMADSTQIQQVIVNLCTNAAHAMAEKAGAITIGLERVEAGPGQNGKAPAALSPGNYACIAVADTGCGIPKELHSRVFDPFFSTKDTDQGTGLGLSTVLGIVKGHCGDITIDSAAGQGTTFRVYLPMHPVSRSRKRSTGKSTAKLARGQGERIMVVDDEEAIAKLSGRMLESLGYETEVFFSPEEALAAFRERPDDFALVLTDLTMPGITGDQLALEMRAIRSGFPIIILSGFTEGSVLEQADVSCVLAKPVSVVVLSNAIRDALAKPAES